MATAPAADQKEPVTLESQMFDSIANNQFDKLQPLLDQGAKVTAVNSNYLDYTMLHYACAEDRLDFLLAVSGRPGWNEAKDGTKPINAKDFNGYTPLHWAGKRDKPEFVDRVLSLEGDPTIINKMNRTPIHVAAYEGRVDNLRKMLARVPKENLPNVLGQKAIDQRPWLGRTALHDAADQGHLEAVNVLLEAGASVKLTDAEGNTPLHVACARGRAEVALRLIDALKAIGSLADIDTKNSAELSPFQLACKKSHWRLAQLLLDQGAPERDNPADSVEEEKRLNVGQAIVLARRFSEHVIPEIAQETAAYLHGEIAVIIKDVNKLKKAAVAPPPGPASQ